MIVSDRERWLLEEQLDLIMSLTGWFFIVCDLMFTCLYFYIIVENIDDKNQSLHEKKTVSCLIDYFMPLSKDSLFIWIE